MEHKGIENLRPFKEKTAEEKSAQARKAGKIGGAAKRRNEKMRDTTQLVLATRIKNEALETEMRAAGFKGTLTYQDLLIYRLFMKALGNGHDSVAAFKEIRSLAGEAEAIKIDMTLTPTLDEQAQRITAVLNEYRAVE